MSVLFVVETSRIITQASGSDSGHNFINAVEIRQESRESV